MASAKLNGSTRLRSNKGFSSDNSYFAFIYVPNDEPQARYMKAVDLRTGKIVDIVALPTEVKSPAHYLEFSWFDKNTLLLVVKEDLTETKIYYL